MNKLFKQICMVTGLLIAPFFYVQARVVEVSTPLASDFKSGGDYETSPRLIGNASAHFLGIIQNNQVRIKLSTPTRTDVYGSFFVNGVEVASQAAAIAASTNALQNNINALYTNVASTYTSLIAAINSTNTALSNRIDQSAISTTSHASQLSALHSSTANITNRADAVAITTTSTALYHSAVISSTQNITSRADAVAVSTTLQTLYNAAVQSSTANITARGDAVALSTTATLSSLNSLNASTANITARADSVAIATTMAGAVYIGSATVYGTVTSTSGFVGDGSKLYNLPAASGGSIAVADEGTFKGQASTINFIGSNVSVVYTGQTADVTVTGGSGGGTTNQQYELIIGTSAVRGATIIGNTQAAFNFAIASATAKLVAGSSDTVTIYVQRGSYTFTSSVFVPIGVTIKGEDHGAIIWNTNALGLFKIEGRVTNMGFCITPVNGTSPGEANANYFIQVANGGRFDHCKFHQLNLGALPGGGVTQITVFDVNGGSNTWIEHNVIENYKAGSYTMYYLHGNNSHNHFNYNKITEVEGGAVNGYGIFFYTGKSNEVGWNYIFHRKGNVFMPTLQASGLGDVSFNFHDNYVSMDSGGTDGNGASLFQTGGGGEGISTGTVIANNYFQIRVPGTATGLFSFYDNGGDINGMLWENNTIISSNTTTQTPFYLYSGGNQPKRTEWKNNTIQGFSSFMTDGGLNTLYTGRNNSVNGVQQ